MVRRENMPVSPSSAMETPGRSILSSTRSRCFLCSRSNFFFFLKGWIEGLNLLGSEGSLSMPSILLPPSGTEVHWNSPHLLNSATSWAFISARVWFSCSSSSSSLEGCLVVPPVDSSSSSPSSSSPELRLTKQSEEFGYFPRQFLQYPVQLSQFSSHLT